MKEMKHTPGPWINDGDTISGRTDPENSKTYIAPICTIDPDWDESIAQANARLIAAAPELLEALQLIAETDSIDAALDPQRAIRVARAAISQATGQSK